MLSLNTPITQTDINKMKALGTHGNVWLLTGFHEDKIVVKKERGATSLEVKHANFAVKAIAPNAKSKALSQQELTAIDQYIWTFEQLEREYAALEMSVDNTVKHAIESYKYMKTSYMGTFVKMDPVNIMDLQDAYLARMDGDKRDLRTFADTLNANGGFERLGKIIAVDLFIQNRDRFWPNDTGAYRKIMMEDRDGNSGMSDFKVRCLGNVGNVFRIDTGGGNEVGALDFVYRNWDMDKPLLQCERENNDKWGGRYLADAVKRDGFAKDVVQDLEIILSPNRGTFSLKKKLKSDAGSRVARGMIEGAGLIKTRLESKYGPPRGWTQGARDRYDIIRQVR